MSKAPVPSSLPNDSIVVPAEVIREAEFLSQLLRIRDDVVAGIHPRIRLPTKAIEYVAPRFQQTTTKSVTNGVPKGAGANPQLLPPRPEVSLPKIAPPNLPAQRLYSAKPVSSSIDPVLLAKSDHLIKAELQLKRQQIERSIKDEVDKKSRSNDAEEREAFIDVEECLIQAHLRVPPISGTRLTNNNSDSAESFDESSYYSSKADSWSSEEADPNQKHNLDATSPVSHVNRKNKQAATHARVTEHTVIDLDEEAYEPVDDIEIYEPDAASRHEDVEEEDYSPPPAHTLSTAPLKARARNREMANFDDANGSYHHQSPTSLPTSIQNPRKRRREEKQAEKRRRHQQQEQQSATERIIRSPETFIKDEPQSPPPLSAYPDSQRSKRRALQSYPHDVDVLSAPSSDRVRSDYHREQESFSDPHEIFEEPPYPNNVRTSQRAGRRDDQGLRRVASLQYALRPYPTSSSSGKDVFLAPEPRQTRAVSHAFADRPEPAIHREASVWLPPAQRYVRDRSRSPLHEYLPQEHLPTALMAPPPRRVVIDQYGNKYFAAPVNSAESSIPSRQLDVDRYHQRARTREPTVRAPYRSELYEEGLIQRMPPPRRRYGEVIDSEVIESPSFRQQGLSRHPVEMEYRPIPQYEEMSLSRDHAPARAYSMRPEIVRRDVPIGHARHESIQPASVRASQPRFREVSIVHQEPADIHPYISVPQNRRFIEETSMEMARELSVVESRRGAHSRY